jgi:hypothetical protein
MKRRSRSATRLGLAAAIVLLAASPAAASYDPVGSGTAILTLDPGFKKLLAKSAIELTGRKGAKVRGNRVTLIAPTGKTDPTINKAEIESPAELIFTAGRSHLALDHITFFAKPTPLIAKLGGGQLKIAKAASVKLTREGFGNRLDATALKLTAKAATRLAKRLHTDAFATGQPLGTLRVSSQPANLAVLPTGHATIEFDPTIYAKLKALSASVNPIFPAEHVGLTYTFPIGTEGHIAPDGRSGTLHLVGNLEFLRLDFGQIFWSAPSLDLAALALSAELDLEPTPKFSGELGPAPLLTSNPSAPTVSSSSNPAARTVAVTGIPLMLNAAAAQQFNAAFAEGKPEFAPGEFLATLGFAAQTQ